MAIYNDCKSRYKFQRYDKKLVVFVFYGRLHELLPIFWGSQVIYNDNKTRYMFERYDEKLIVFVFYGLFHELLPIVLEFQGDLQRVQPDTSLRDMTKNSSFSCFMAVFMSYCP